MDYLVFQIINGIIIGSVYALIALGLNLIWAITDVPDFSQGAIYVIAAYVGFFTVTLVKLPFLASIFVAMCAGAAIAFSCERMLFRRWRGTVLNQLLCAIALFFLMSNLAVVFWTGKAKFFPSYLPGKIPLLGFYITWERLVVVVIAAILFVLVYSFITKTRIGKAIQAASQDKETAEMMGINIDTVNSVVFALGGALSSTAAILTAPLYSVYPTMGDLPLLKSLVVVILGGFGSVGGVLVCGLGLGIVESLGGFYISSAYQHGYSFFVLILVLLFRPKGLFGRM